MSTFNEQDHPRHSDGRFAGKPGQSAGIGLTVEPHMYDKSNSEAVFDDYYRIQKGIIAQRLVDYCKENHLPEPTGMIMRRDDDSELVHHIEGWGRPYASTYIDAAGDKILLPADWSEDLALEHRPWMVTDLKEGVPVQLAISDARNVLEFARKDYPEMPEGTEASFLARLAHEKRIEEVLPYYAEHVDRMKSTHPKAVAYEITRDDQDDEPRVNLIDKDGRVVGEVKVWDSTDLPVDRFSLRELAEAGAVPYEDWREARTVVPFQRILRKAGRIADPKDQPSLFGDDRPEDYGWHDPYVSAA